MNYLIADTTETKYESKLTKKIPTHEQVRRAFNRDTGEAINVGVGQMAQIGHSGRRPSILCCLFRLLLFDQNLVLNRVAIILVIIPMIVQHLGRLLMRLEELVHLLLQLLLLRLQLALVLRPADALLHGCLVAGCGSGLTRLGQGGCRGLVVFNEVEEFGNGNHRPQSLPGLAVEDGVILPARRCLRHLAGKVGGLLALACQVDWAQREYESELRMPAMAITNLQMISKQTKNDGTHLRPPPGSCPAAPGLSAPSAVW